MAYKFAEAIQRSIIYLTKSVKDFYLQIINLVKPEYFEYGTHKKIYESIIKHYEKYKVLPNDQIILENVKELAIDKDSISEYNDELEIINNLDKTSIENKTYFLDKIEQFARREALKLAIAKSINLIKEDKMGDIEEEIKKALSINRNIDLGQNYFIDVNDRWDRIKNCSNENKFKTVFNELNDVLEGGNSRKELCMVVAPGGVGKSLYLVNQGVRALMENKKVLVISLEMSEDRIAQRFDSVMTLIPQAQLASQKDLLSKRLALFKTKFPNSELKIKEFPTGRATANTIRALLSQLQNYEEFSPDLIIVDYLELLRATTEGMPEYQAQERIAQELRGIAVEYNCLVWTATQTNRDGRKTLVITDVDLADSYGKIRTCDFSISLNQTDQEYEQGNMRIYVMKSRNSKQRFLFPSEINYNTLIMSSLKEEDKPVSLQNTTCAVIEGVKEFTAS